VIGSRRRTAAIVVAVLACSTIDATVTRLALAGAPSGPPPTPAPPNGSPSPFPQVLHTPADPIPIPTVDVPVALLADLDNGQVMFAKGAEARRPIASLTKIMTAVLVLERADLDDVVTVPAAAVFERDDYGASSTLGLREGERRTVRELLYALLLQSANDAAVALAIDVGGSEDAFVRAMNRRARSLGMRRTLFFSPNGLDDRGRSTAHDLLRLVRVAYETDGFASIVATRFRTIPGPSGAPPREIQNRNAMLWLYPGAVGVKTGFTAGAGTCLVTVAERGGRRLVVIILGSGDEAFSEAGTLLDHGFEGFREETFVTSREPMGTVSIRGGVVSVEAGARLRALAPVAALGNVRRTVVVSPTVAFPPAEGERVAALKVTLPGVTVGTVPLLVSSVPPPPPAGDAPWWARAAGAIVGGVGAVLGGLFG
jgi:serine-type D-Ala-D-Ala carboxypeptidase (penicillin-binding protein 5/6)